MLRDAPYLYRLAAVSAGQADRSEMLVEFNRLRKQLRRARIHKYCRGKDCEKRAKWMTLPTDWKGRHLARPYYWCDGHEPWEEDGVSDKLPVHFDVIKRFRFDKRGQKIIFRKVRSALGIQEGTRLTEEKAIRFFAHLSQKG
jgi:hypothetical protein